MTKKEILEYIDFHKMEEIKIKKTKYRLELIRWFFIGVGVGILIIELA